MKKRNILTYFKVMAFAFVCLFAVGITKVDASTVTVTTYNELKEAVNGHNDGITDTSITEVKLGANIAIPASSVMGIYVVNDFTLDLNGYGLDITDSNSIMSINYGSNGIENFTSGSLTITDTSESQTGTIKLGIKPIFVYQQNVSNTGMHYKLTIDGGKFYGTSGAYNRFFEFNTDNSYYWKDKLITFDFKITKGYFEHVSTNMSSIILASDMRLNNITFNMSFDNLTFKSGNNRLIASSESYSIDDVVPEDTNFYIFNSSEDKQVLIAERSISAKTEVPSSLWHNVDGYTNLNYAGIKLVKKDGFDVTAPTFDSVNYGYTSVSAKEISIYNRGTSDLKVKSVKVDEPSKFTVIGTTQPTIASKATDNTSFTIKPVDGLEAGTYTARITVTDMSDKIYTATVTFIVEKSDITPTVSVSDVEYGTSVNPTINGNTGSGTVEYHYIDSEENDTTTKPTNAGSYKVYAIIGETTNYKGATTSQEDFTINPKSITIAVDTIADQTYTGLEKTPTVVVKDGSTILTEGTDYEVVYSDNINAGTAKATISKVTNGNYTFSDKEVNFTIKKVQLEKVTLVTDTIVYNGSGSFPAMDNYNDSLQELSGTLGATNVGDYTTTVALKDKNNYEWTDGTPGNLTLNWKIIQATIADASVTLPQATYRVTGSEITPEPTVVVNGRTLTKDTDYTVSYTDNTNIGTATVTVTGKNNYKGTGIATFEIANKEVLTISGLNNNEEFTYDGTSKTPTGTLTVTGDKVPVGELDVKYTGTGYDSTDAPKNAGTYTITYKVKDSNPNYVGSVTYTFTIKKAQLDKVTLTKDTFEYTGSDITPTLNNVNSNIEVTGDTKAKNVSNNTITAKITDKTNYEWKDGSNSDLTINWSITQATPDYTVPTGLTGVKGETLNDVPLPDRFTWNDASTVLTAGKHTYKAKYTPVDTINYKTITDIDIEVNVKDTFAVITSVPGGNGTITPSILDVVEGTNVEITFIPDAGYMIDKVLVNTVETTVTGNKIELTVDEEKDVAVSYKKIPFTVTVKDVDGATITPNGVVAVSYGEDKEFIITANSGYKLVKVLVDETDKTADMVGDTLKLTNITSNINLEVVVERIVYEVTEGANQKYTITKNNEAKFKINADFRLFDDGKVYVDNELVDPKNYTAESGSTIITLKKEFVDTLSVGEHTLKVLFNDGGEAITTFNVAKVTVPTDNPQTGDNIGFYIISGILSIVGLAGAGIFYRRKQTN